MRNLRPIVIYSDRFLDAISWFMKIGGIALFPFIILREKYSDTSNDFWLTRGKKTINHETIHFQQAIELGVIFFYILYVLEWLVKLPIYKSSAYENISFEREAYGNDYDLTYMNRRKRYNWMRLILNKN